MLVHWYVVASQNCAKVLTQNADALEFVQIKELNNPLGRERIRSLIRKDASLGMKSTGRGAVHYSQTKRHDPHEQAAQQFAIEITDYLKKSRLEKKFNSLTVVAEPRFLGKIRSAMEVETKNRVVIWLKKDLVKHSLHELSHILLNKQRVPELTTEIYY